MAYRGSAGEIVAAAAASGVAISKNNAAAAWRRGGVTQRFAKFCASAIVHVVANGEREDINIIGVSAGISQACKNGLERTGGAHSNIGCANSMKTTALCEINRKPP